MRTRSLLASFMALALLGACAPDGAGPPGDAAPKLVSASPADGATGVLPGEALVLTFSAPVKSLALTPSPLVGLATPVYNPARDEVTVAPSPAWPLGTTLSFAIVVEGDGGAKRDVHLGFTTLTDDSPPAAPVGVAAEALDGAMRVSWTANTEPDLAGYLLFWGEDAAAPTGVASLPATATEHVVTALTNDTLYHAYLVARDAVGNTSDSSPTVSATPLDKTAPTLISSQPSDGVKGTGLVTLVRFVFSEPVAPGSLALQLFEVEAPTGDDPIDPDAAVVATLDAAGLGAASWNSGSTVVEFGGVAADLFESDKAYRMELTAEDLAGNPLPDGTSVSFLTGFVPDVVPPRVTMFQSAANPSTGGGVMTFQFSEAMDQAKTEAAFNSVPAVGCTWAWPAPDTVICTIGAGGLEQNRQYLLQLGTGASDLMGNGLSAPWSMGLDMVNFNPRLIGSEPAPGKFGAPPRTTNPRQPISWTFNEPMRLAGMAGSIHTGGGQAFDTITPARVALSADSLTITYYPPSDYACQGNIYSWELTAAYEEGEQGVQPVLSIPVAYTGSFQCGAPVIGSGSGAAARGE